MQRSRSGTLAAALVTGILLAGAGEATADRRVALVIGNSSYAHVAALATPGLDVDAVAGALRRAGFDVVTGRDLTRLQFEDMTRRFLRTAAGADIGLFYYSGHGVQVGDQNFLIPVDAQLRAAEDLELESYALEGIVSALQARTRTQLVFLDACRNYPLKTRAFLQGTSMVPVGATRGLARITASTGSLLVYSTAPGSVAQDGRQGAPSPFSGSFASNALAPDREIRQVLAQVRRDVMSATGGQQVPWESSSLTEDIFLVRSTGTDAAPARQPPAAALSDLPAAMARDIPLGVGPVGLDIPAAPAASAATATLTSVPALGVLTLRGTTVTAGMRLSRQDLAQLAFTPQADSEGSGHELVVSDAAGGQRRITLTGSLLACDRLAGEPLDLQGVGPGLLANDIDPPAAIAACTADAARYPAIGRFQYQLGRAYLAGRDVVKAQIALRVAHRLGHVRAAYGMGYMTQNGIGETADDGRAAGLYREAAVKVDPFGLYSYGKALYYGRGVKADPASGLIMMGRAAELGHTYAMNELGAIYANGRGVKADPGRGMRYYAAGAERKDIWSINNLGIAFAFGQGVPEDAARARSLMMTASDGGHPLAPNELGELYANGRFGAPDAGEATRWYRLGVERGDGRAAINLARLIGRDAKLAADPQEVTRLYAFAASSTVDDVRKAGAAGLTRQPASTRQAVLASYARDLGQALPPRADDRLLVTLARRTWEVRNPRRDLF